MNLDFGIQKTNAGIRINFQKMSCVSIWRQNRQLWLILAQVCPKRNLELKIQKTNIGIPCVPIFRQNGQLWLFEPKFAQKWILGSEFQKSKSGFGINTSNIPCVPIFSQNGQLLIFWPKFGEIAQLRAIFWFKYCWGCCRELGGGWNELGGGWNELGGAGWSAWFSNAFLKVVLHTRLNVYWESSGGSRFVTQSLGVIQMVTNKIYFMHQFDFSSK